MKTVIIEYAIAGMAATGPNGPVKIHAQQINEFAKEIPMYKQMLFQLMQDVLPLGGFEYGGDLYKYRIGFDGYRMQLIAIITFEDTNNVGKTEFMKQIQRTKLLPQSEIIKPYS